MCRMSHGHGGRGVVHARRRKETPPRHARPVSVPAPVGLDRPLLLPPSLSLSPRSQLRALARRIFGLASQVSESQLGTEEFVRVRPREYTPPSPPAGASLALDKRRRRSLCSLFMRSFRILILLTSFNRRTLSSAHLPTGAAKRTAAAPVAESSRVK